MYSFSILAAILFAFVTLTSALQCRPVLCMIHCQYGFDVDAQGCEICTCRRSSVDSSTILPQTTNRLIAAITTTTRVKSTTTKKPTTTRPRTTTTAKTRPTTTTRHAFNGVFSTATGGSTARRWFRTQ
jgi:hypothetical protein